MTPDINFYAINDNTASNTPSEKVVYYTNPNEAIVFGNFTLEECAQAQKTPRPTSISVATQTTDHLLNYPIPPPLYFRQPIPCSRCGHLSHTVDKCVAKWNINRERIPYTTPKKAMYPSQSPPISPNSRANDIHYYNTHIHNEWSSSDKTKYNQFVFSSDDINEWIDEQQELFVPPLPSTEPETDKPHIVYIPLLIRNRTRYASVVIPTADQEIDYILRYNYAMTDYMLGRQMMTYAY